MKQNLSVWQLGGFTFAVVLGTILHFVFDWTKAYFLTPISAVNESTWEHMKILFFPMLVFALIQSPFFKEETGFWWIKLIGILIGVLGIPVLFYTYNGAFGSSPDWLNILFFFLSAGIAYLVEYFLFRKGFTLSNTWIPITILTVFTAFFFVFTFYPPKLPLFQDPLTKTYGIVR